MEKFMLGVVVGGVAGALLTANNYKMRTLVKKSQEEVQAKLDKLMDEKIQAMGEGVEEMAAAVSSGDEKTTSKKSKK